jgi:C4-dicarboxylate-specific signal transduction histidine kinase
MTASEWAAIAVAVGTLIGFLVTGVRFLVKSYLSELKSNGGSSLRDSVDRLERQVEEIYRILITRSKP